MRLLKPFFKTAIDSFEDVERLQDTIENVFNGITNSPILSGQLVESVDLDTTAIRVEHKLGRAALGYIIVRQNADATVYEETDTRPDLFLKLKSSSPVKVSLWVF